MGKTVEFFFDYVSPTSYLAHFVVPGVAQRTGAELVYRPVFQGGVMQATGNVPPGTVAAKGRYMAHDLQRCARRIGVPLIMNRHFPMNTLVLTRATVGMAGEPDKQRRFIDACFRHCYGIADGIDPTNAEQLKAMCDAEGFDVEEIVALANDPANKDRLKANTEEGIARGIFGTPSFFVGDELFFGQDRLDYVEDELAR